MNRLSFISHKLSIAIAAIIAIASVSCTSPSVPDTYAMQTRQPYIMPDYTEVTIPCNLCPTNFIVTESGKQAVVRMSAGTTAFTYGDGMKVMIDPDEWEVLKHEALGGSIKVEVFVKADQGWNAYKPFNIYVAADSIDPYISYRLIPPSYVDYSHLALAQRNLTTFDETVFYDNRPFSTADKGQCVNCHSYQNYHTNRMLFHMRHNNPGTLIVDGDQVKRVNLKTDSTISAGVYPTWHPTLPLIAFSTNLTGQTFHTKDLAKIEVQDLESDLILYDLDRNSISTISALPDQLEVFPTWSADGQTLYYCSAHFAYESDSTREDELITRYKDIHYNIYSRSFDPTTQSFGEPRLIFNADSLNQSATLPRTSPDGRYMVFALAPWGCFHVWHHEADIHIIDLNTMQAQPLSAINSKRSESYPSFSSSGRWLMTASRRDDGNYTRPYIAYFDNTGTCHKPFELPQRDPYHYIYYLNSYNRPEFMIEPVPYTADEFAGHARQQVIKATYNGQQPTDTITTDGTHHDEKSTTFTRLSETS